MITHKLNIGVGEKKTYQKKERNRPTKKQKQNKYSRNTSTRGTLYFL